MKTPYLPTESEAIVCAINHAIETAPNYCERANATKHLKAFRRGHLAPLARQIWLSYYDLESRFGMGRTALNPVSQVNKA